MDKQKEIERIVKEDFVEYFHKDYGAGYFCTQNVLDNISDNLFTKSDVEKEIEVKKETLLRYFGMLSKAPELNPSNYTHDEVCQLNRDMIEIWGEMHCELNELETQLKEK